MKTIVAGSRHMTDYAFLNERMQAVPWEITEVVCGCAPGADTLGSEWAQIKGIPVSYFPADWKKLGRAAGPIRNKQMAENADALVAFLYPGSRGTANMIKQAHKLKLRVCVVYCTENVNPGVFGI